MHDAAFVKVADGINDRANDSARLLFRVDLFFADFLIEFSS